MGRCFTVGNVDSRASGAGAALLFTEFVVVFCGGGLAVWPTYI
jgi:hypothetical protein